MISVWDFQRPNGINKIVYFPKPVQSVYEWPDDHRPHRPQNHELTYCPSCPNCTTDSQNTLSDLSLLSCPTCPVCKDCDCPATCPPEPVALFHITVPTNKGKRVLAGFFFRFLYRPFTRFHGHKCKLFDYIFLLRLHYFIVIGPRQLLEVFTNYSRTFWSLLSWFLPRKRSWTTHWFHCCYWVRCYLSENKSSTELRSNSCGICC